MYFESIGRKYHTHQRGSGALIGSALLVASLGAQAQAVMSKGWNDGWRSPDHEHIAVLELESGPVVIELNPTFAPKTVERFKTLVRERFYDGEAFYRVIDGFVAQGGDGSDIDPEAADNPNALPPEFERTIGEDTPWRSVQKNDLFAPETGFVNGFAAARDGDKIWLTHCPGVVAMARGTEADSGSSDFYIVIGQAPRYLDRNLTIFGRVIRGMEHVQRINRGPAQGNGIIDDIADRTLMHSIRIAADLNQGDRPYIQVHDTNSDTFQETLDGRRQRTNEWFIHTPPEVLDVCQIPMAGRKVPQAVYEAVDE